MRKPMAADGGDVALTLVLCFLTIAIVLVLA